MNMANLAVSFPHPLREVSKLLHATSTSLRAENYNFTEIQEESSVRTLVILYHERNIWRINYDPELLTASIHDILKDSFL